jgi:putative hydrolase of the HAD superfamily
VGVSAVIFDWGGTLTPWHTIDHDGLWGGICVPHYDPDQATRIAAALRLAENELWALAEREHRSSTLEQLFSRAGVEPSAAFVDSYFQAWEPHTITDPAARDLLTELRGRGIKIGVLSNTMNGSSPETACST